MLPKNLNDRKYFQFFQDNVAYTNDAGTAVPIGQFVGGQYNLTAPTYADGDPAVFQFTSSGLLKTDATLSIEGDINIGSVELKDATSDTRAVVKSDGTNNALVVTMNVLPSLVAGSATIGDVTVSSLSALVEGTATIGSVKLTDGAEVLLIATDGAAVKTKGIMFMGTDGTNAQTVSMNSDGDVNIADGGNVITVDGSGSAGTAATGVVTIQGIASMTAVQVGDNSSSLSIDIGGMAPQLDDTDKIAVSLYGKGTAAGDTAVDTDTDGHLQIDVLTMPSLEIGEFPAAAAITDDFANPTTTNIMAMNMVWDGATWDRMAGTSTDGVLVNLGTNNDITVTSGTITSITNAVAVTGTFWQATQPVSGTFWQATQPVSGTFWQATQPVSGTVAATQSGTWTVQPGNTANTTAWLVTGTGGTFPVTGTFWQATQPVSGTFYQATQPVSIAATVVTSDAATTSIDGKITACNTGAVVISSGTITAVTSITNAVAVTNADITSSKTALEIIDNCISGNEAQVDVITLPATPAGTNAIGKLLPPNIDVTTHTYYARKYFAGTGAQTDGIVWSPAAGTRWHIVSMYVQTSAAATITLEDDKAGGDDPVWKGEFAANQGMTINFGEMYSMDSAEDAADLLVTTTAGNIYITAIGYEI